MSEAPTLGSDAAPILTAVIVLYQRTAAESEAFVSLQRIIETEPEIGGKILLLLYDNSPTPASGSVERSFCEIRYRPDPENGGLASAYQYALEQAEAAGSEWLLLLDQDTTLTQEYFSQLLLAIQQNSQTKTIAAFVPFLEMGGRIYSPERTFFYHLRHQFPHAREYPLSRDDAGVQPIKINAYNSGAAVSVKALLLIGGFPTQFPVDYLDHAIFHLLQLHGYAVYLLSATLQQKLSHSDLNNVSYSRHQSVLGGQIRFVSLYGTWMDRLLLRLWLLRKGRSYRHFCKDPRVWRGMVQRAIGHWPRRQKDGSLP